MDLEKLTICSCFNVLLAISLCPSLKMFSWTDAMLLDDGPAILLPLTKVSFLSLNALLPGVEMVLLGVAKPPGALPGVAKLLPS
jgi:hypothetical protein